MAARHVTETFSITTTSGTAVEVTASHSDMWVLMHASVGGARPVSGSLNGPTELPTIGEPAASPIAQQLRQSGASHFATIDGTGAVLGLDASTAAAINEAADRAETALAAHKQRLADERVASIRAEAVEIRKVLCWAPSWGTSLTEAARLPEDHPSLAQYAAWAKAETRLSLGEELEVDSACPSLADVRERSAYWGCFAGHDNQLRAISDADWDLLLRETAEVRAARDSKLKARIKELEATEVPDRALEAFRKYKGDPEAADAAEDEEAMHLIHIYSNAIEAQGLAHRSVGRFDLEFHPPGA